MSDQKYITYNIYRKIKESNKAKDSATPLKSIYAKNHNMFMNAVPEARDGMDRGFVTGGGEAKRNRPVINKDDKPDEEVLKNGTNLATPNLTGDTPKKKE